MARNKSKDRQVAQAPHSLQLPTLNQKKSGDALHPPIGGFYTTLERLNISEPLRTFQMNEQAAQKRALGTIPENAMTPDIHSAFWSLP